MLQIGEKAPEVLGFDENGKEIRLADFQGKKLVLYFYPKDSLPTLILHPSGYRI